MTLNTQPRVTHPPGFGTNGCTKRSFVLVSELWLLQVPGLTSLKVGEDAIGLVFIAESLVSAGDTLGRVVSLQQMHHQNGFQEAQQHQGEVAHAVNG